MICATWLALKKAICPSNASFADGLGPVRLWILRGSLGIRSRIYRSQTPLLPLKEVGGCQGILPVAIELDRSLHALKRVGVEYLHQFGVVDTLRFIDGLFQHLQHRIRLHRVPGDTIGGTAELGDILLLE